MMPPSGEAARRAISAARARPRATGAAGGPLGQGTQPEPAERGLELLELAGRNRHGGGVGAGLAERLQGHALEQLRLLDQLGLRLGDVLLHRPRQLVQHRQHLGADAVAGEDRLLVGLVVGEGEPGGRGKGAHLGPPEPDQWPDQTPAPRRQAAQRADARGCGEAVEDGLGQVGAGVAGGDPVGARAGPQALGGVVARRSRLGLEVALAELRALDVQVDAEQAAERPRRLLARVGRLAQAIVDVQGVDVGSLEGGREAGRRAGRIRAAGDQNDAAGMRVDEAAASNDVGQPGEGILLAPHGRGDLTGRVVRLHAAAPGASRSGCSLARATNSSTRRGKPFSSTSPIGSKRR